MKKSLLRLGNTFKETFGDSKWALKKTQSYEKKREEIKYTNTMREERRERKDREGGERREEGGRERGEERKEGGKEGGSEKERKREKERRERE